MSHPLVATAPQSETRHYNGEYDPARLRRALMRAVQPLGDAKFLVAGNEEPSYVVDLTQDVPCFCKDAEFHGRGCLHELAGRLHNGDSKLITAAGQMLLAAEQRNETPRRKRRVETTT